MKKLFLALVMSGMVGLFTLSSQTGISHVSPDWNSNTRVYTTTRLPRSEPNKSRPPAAAPLITLGYYTGTQESFDALRDFAASLKIVSADVFTIQSDGSIVGEDPFDVVSFDQAHRIQTYACVNNYSTDADVDDFDPKLAHAAIVTHRRETISAMVTLAREGKYDGVNVDFENLAYSADIQVDRKAFNAFIHDLAVQLHAGNKKLIISVPAKSEDSKDNTWSYPFDLAALGRDADYLQLMTYDQHGTWSAPGPVSGVDWLADCLTYTSSLVAPAKLLIGLPAYGYNWDLSESDAQTGKYSAESFFWKDIPALVALPGAKTHWDTPSLSPSVTYKKDGHAHEAWFENEDSIQAKMKLVKEYRLAGLSMWALGQDDARFWQAIRIPKN